MRALVISDTHFGAWTGEDLLREQANLDLLEPHLDVDVVIVLGSRLFEKRLEGVEVDFRYPTYTFGGVLCTHGHYLDVHAERAGSRLNRLLGETIWKIAVGSEHPTTLDDYEATATLLTELLFTIAQVPNGTNTERSVYKSFEMLGRAVRRAAAPRRALEAVAQSAQARLDAGSSSIDRRSAGAAETYEGARSHETERRRRTGACVRSSGDEPWLGGAHEPDRVRPHASTTRRCPRLQRKVPLLQHRLWIYEPDLGSQRAYMAYLHNAWPGTAVLIDTDEDQPQLLRLREHLNPLNAMDGGRGEHGNDRSAS